MKCSICEKDIGPFWKKGAQIWCYKGGEDHFHEKDIEGTGLVQE